MPKEQGHFGERAARGSSKTAKDESNSATLRASQCATHRGQSGVGDVTKHVLCCDSEKDLEKDSGYSEAGSDSVHTDVDDQRSSVSEPHRGGSDSSDTGSGSVNAGGHGLLAPIYVMENLVVKPSRREQLLHGPLVWGSGWHSLTNAKAPAQLLLIQQPAMPAPSSSTLTPPSSLPAPQAQGKKGGSRSGQNRSGKNSYLPILNSYPRIAPHPRKESHEGKSAAWVDGVKESGTEGHSQSKRVCIQEEEARVVSTTSHLLKPQQQHQKERRVHSHSQYGIGGLSSIPSSSHCSLPSHSSSTVQHKSHHCQRSSGSDSVSSPSISSSQMPSPPSFSDSSPPSSSPSPSTAHSPYHLPPDSSCTRHCRFLNTAEILNQSGLLAITLRTKELLKQNAATEREISQLRQHTHLLCQAAQASQNGRDESLDSLGNLLQAMNDSGSYPNLNQLKALDGSPKQSKTRSEEDKEKESSIRVTKNRDKPAQVVSLHTVDDGTSPPSPLFAPSPDTGERLHADAPLDPVSTPLSVYFPRQQVVMGKNVSDLTVLPESSMHNTYLL